MTETPTPQLELLFSFFERLDRKAPGSRESTCKALSLVTGMSTQPHVVDLGCGSGASTLVLAEVLGHGSNLTAVDIHQAFLDDLDSRAARLGLSTRITTLRADMSDLPLADGQFDLVWSEGAIYLLGFAEGLRRWRRLLRPGGHIAISEVAWLAANQPPAAQAFWHREYPAITSIDRNLDLLREAGFCPVGHFTLPAKDWFENYVKPVEMELPRFRSEYIGDSAAEAVADELQAEVELWRECGDSYGYVFFVAKVD